MLSGGVLQADGSSRFLLLHILIAKIWYSQNMFCTKLQKKMLNVSSISVSDQYSALMAVCAGKKESKGRVETARVLINKGAVVNSHDR